MSTSSQDVCPEEKKAQSASPFGKVEHDEPLARIVLIEECDQGRMKRSAFQSQELWNRGGWSFTRKNYAGNMQEVLKDFAKDKKYHFSEYTYATAHAGEIRKILNHLNHQALCVIDDFVPRNPAHALAKSSSCIPPGSCFSDIRGALLEIFKVLQ